jgi:hypothetical protein
MSILTKEYFQNEAAAFAHLERVLWSDGPICPHCGTIGKAGRLNGVKGKNGKTRPGLWKCYSKGCRKQFSARGYHRVLRVARTLADLDGVDKVGRVHLAEALSYRALADEVRRAA